MSEDRKDMIVMSVLCLLFAIAVVGLVNALLLQQQSQLQPQGYSISIEYVPAPQAKESKQ